MEDGGPSFCTVPSTKGQWMHSRRSWIAPNEPTEDGVLGALINIGLDLDIANEIVALARTVPSALARPREG